MTINLLNVTVRHERRVRLLFSGPPAAAAFTSTAYYAVPSTDDVGQTPLVTAVFAILGLPNQVELQLGVDLARGGKYRVVLAAMPAADLSTCSDQEVFAYAAPSPNIALRNVRDDFDELLYGVDLVHAGGDYLEDQTGDLASITGPAAVLEDVVSSLLSDGLAWDAKFGARPRRYVDAPAPAIGAFRSDIARACLKDDRVQKATVTLDPTSLTTPEQAFFAVAITLKSDPAKAFTARVPLRTG